MITEQNIRIIKFDDVQSKSQITEVERWENEVKKRVGSRISISYKIGTQILSRVDRTRNKIIKSEVTRRTKNCDKNYRKESGRAGYKWIK